MRLRPPVSDLSIRTKVILMVAGTLMLAVLFTAYLVRQLVSQNILNQKLTTVEILTTSILHDITYYSDRDSEEAGQQIIAKYMTYYRIITHMAIYNRRFVCIATSDVHRTHQKTRDPEILGAVVEARPSLHVSRADRQGLGIRSIAPIMRGSRAVGAVTVYVSLQDVQQTLAAIDRRIALIMAAQLALVSTALFVLLRGSILLRLRRLMTVTQQITEGNYGLEVGDRRGDEIGQLGRAFDRMTADLQRSKLEIESYNKRLEQRLREATAELQKAYEDLQNAQSQLVLNEKMASLGVLIAGVAHEINTPAGAILNVSRNLERQLRSLPRDLQALSEDVRIPMSGLVACLEELLETSRSGARPVSYKTQREVEAVLRDRGIDGHKAKAAALCKLNFTEPERIGRYVEWFRMPSFFSFAESFASIAQAATISQTSSQKIAEVVAALKYYAYSDKDRVETTQINESISTALVLLRSQLKHDVTVSTDFDPELPRIPCTSEIHQVWTNLLSNACDAIAAHGGPAKGEIHIATRRSGRSIVASITDNGAGVPADKLDRIFDPFFTTKDIGKGTGLGLSIVSGIVKKHGGTIRVESQPGRTCFEIALSIPESRFQGADPVAAAPDAASRSVAEGPPRELATPPRGDGAAPSFLVAPPDLAAAASTPTPWKEAA